MVVVRLARGGSKRSPFYHIVIADRRMPRDGRFIERVGYYDPMAKGHNIQLQVERDRIVYWLGQGAAVSLRVKHLIKKFEKLLEEATKVALVKVSSSEKAQKAKMIKESKTEEKEATEEIFKK